MIKRINNPLPYPYSQFFKEKQANQNLNCLEDTAEQCATNNNFALIIAIILLLFNSKPLNISQSSEANLEASSKSDSTTNNQSNNDNYYE